MSRSAVIDDMVRQAGGGWGGDKEGYLMSSHDPINILGIPAPVLLTALFNAAVAPHPSDPTLRITASDAAEILKRNTYPSRYTQTPIIQIEAVNGRTIGIDFGSPSVIDPSCYDAANGRGAAASVIETLRQRYPYDINASRLIVNMATE